MTRRPKTIAFWGGRLPHWEVENGRYFITIHLAGAIPTIGKRRLLAIAAELKNAKREQQPEWLKIQRLVFRELEHWLDRAQHATLLQRRDIAEMLIESIHQRSHRGTWQMLEFVVMPSHIHLFCELGDARMKDALEDFKRWTGHQAAKILKTDSDRFWQREWFDHWSRSDGEDEKIAAYIRNNPVKALLVQTSGDWPYGSWRSVSQ